MYSCTMPVTDPRGALEAHAPGSYEEDVSVLKKRFSRIINKLMVWWSLGCDNGPHEGYANRSNSQTSLPRAIGSPQDLRKFCLTL